MQLNSRLTRPAFNLYGFIWFFSEFWLAPKDRRPFTYILRDIYHQAPLFTLLFVMVLSYCFGRWWLPVTLVVFGIALGALLTGCLAGHLLWGGKYIEGEQEEPEFNPGDWVKK